MTRGIKPIREDENGEYQEIDETVEIGDGVVIHPDGNVESRSVHTDSLDITPLKIGIVADTHWGHYGAYGLSSSKSELKSNLDEFVTEMNNWDADLTFVIGDAVEGHKFSSKSAAQDGITNLRNHVESQLNAPFYPLWGNHEYDNAASWGSDWSYGPWEGGALSTIASVDDTYYVVDKPSARIIVLNTAYYPSSDNFDQMKVPSGTLSWLEKRLRETDKPTIILSHVGISRGTGEAYDHIKSSNDDWEMDSRLASLIGRFDNVKLGIFGHSHHGQAEYVNSPFDKSLKQQRDNVRYIYQHFLHQLQGDDTVTPFGKLKVWPDGRIEYEQSYHPSTSVPSYWKIDGGRSDPSPRPRFDMRAINDFRWSTSFESIDGYKTSGTGSFYHADSTFNNPKAFVVLETGATSGDTITATFKRYNGWHQGSLGSKDFSPMIFRFMYADVDTSSVEWDIVHGGFDTTPHIGFKNLNGTLKLTAADGTSESTQNIGNAGGQKYLEARFYPERGRLEAYNGGALQGTITSNLPANIDDVAARNILNMRLSTSTGAARQAKITGAELYKTPALPFEK